MRLIGLAVILVLSITLGPLATEAQRTAQLYRVGVVLVGEATPADDTRAVPGLMRAFLDRLADHGYVKGKNLVVEMRRGRYERLAELAAELVRLKVDVIFTFGTKASRILHGVVRDTPLVIHSCDPYEHVARIARPEANLTGVTCMTTELSPKRLELLKELVPKASRVVFLSDPDDAPTGRKLTFDAAPRLGINLQAIDVMGRERLPDALNTVARERPDALFVYPDPILVQERRQIAEFALRNRLPTMYAFREFVDAGGLMSYGASLTEQFASAAEQISQILDGTKPSAVPVRQPTKFELIINLKTAKALGLTIPQTLLLRADQVIE